MTTDIRLDDTKVIVEGPLHTPDDTFVPIKIWTNSLPPDPNYRIELIAVGKELTRLRDALTVIRGEINDLQIKATIEAEAAHYTQDGWRWCEVCRILHFAPNNGRSACQVNKASTHSTGNNSKYTLFPHKSRHAPNQAGWLWCRKCQGLFNADNGKMGKCAATGTHDRSGSPTYVLSHTTAPQGVATQDGWHYCNKCQLLFHGDNVGVCPDGGGTHSAAGSGNYILAHR